MIVDLDDTLTLDHADNMILPHLSDPGFKRVLTASLYTRLQTSEVIHRLFFVLLIRSLRAKIWHSIVMMALNLDRDLIVTLGCHRYEDFYF